MISKISYIKLIREDIRHRGWLAALSGVLLFLSMPVYTLIYLDSYSEAPEDFRLLAEHLYLNPSDFLDRGGTSRDYAEVTFKKENNTFTYLLK